MLLRVGSVPGESGIPVQYPYYEDLKVPGLSEEVGTRHLKQAFIITGPLALYFSRPRP